MSKRFALNLNKSKEALILLLLSPQLAITFFPIII